jgi:hypothetical protein
MVQAFELSEALALLREAGLEAHLDGVMQQIPCRGIQTRKHRVATSDVVVDRGGNEICIGVVHIYLSLIFGLQPWAQME